MWNKRSQPSPASLDVSNDTILLAGTGPDNPAEPLNQVKHSGDLDWDQEEPERQAHKDAELSASADAVWAYLTRIGKIAQVNAEQEVALAQRIEGGLFAPSDYTS